VQKELLLIHNTDGQTERRQQCHRRIIQHTCSASIIVALK